MPQKTHMEVLKLADAIKPGMTIRHFDGEPVTVRNVGQHRDQFGWAIDFSFDEGIVPFAARPTESFTVLVPVPEIGTFASWGLGADSYPFIVTGRSAGGAKVMLQRLECRVVSGSFQRGDWTVEYWANPNNASVPARWSQKRGRWILGGSGAGVSFGMARYYQDPSF